MPDYIHMCIYIHIYNTHLAFFIKSFKVCMNYRLETYVNSCVDSLTQNKCVHIIQYLSL